MLEKKFIIGIICVFYLLSMWLLVWSDRWSDEEKESIRELLIVNYPTVMPDCFIEMVSKTWRFQDVYIFLTTGQYKDDFLQVLHRCSIIQSKNRLKKQIRKDHFHQMKLEARNKSR